MTLLQITQLTIALSVIFVWLFRYENIKKEFELFGIKKIIKAVGITKILISILLIIGLWVPETTLVSSATMGIFMLSAQYFHWSVSNPLYKKLPSIILFSLCIIILLNQLNNI
jgi:hypothetical protein